jgi:multidrug efflux pump subunit AcrB
VAAIDESTDYLRGDGLVILVVLIFGAIRATLILIAAIPVSLIGTFAR